jgi:hypothetical protein
MKNYNKEVCTAKEVMLLIHVSESKACRMIAYLRDVLNKPKPKVVTVQDFIDYYDIKTD